MGEEALGNFYKFRFLNGRIGHVNGCVDCIHKIKCNVKKCIEPPPPCKIHLYKVLPVAKHFIFCHLCNFFFDLFFI